jgi:hypothetical protein
MLDYNYQLKIGQSKKNFYFLKLKKILILLQYEAITITLKPDEKNQPFGIAKPLCYRH